LSASHNLALKKGCSNNWLHHSVSLISTTDRTMTPYVSSFQIQRNVLSYPSDASVAQWMRISTCKPQPGAHPHFRHITDGESSPANIYRADGQ
jgi:hypothetical protein